MRALATILCLGLGISACRGEPEMAPVDDSSLDEDERAVWRKAALVLARRTGALFTDPEIEESAYRALVHARLWDEDDLWAATAQVLAWFIGSLGPSLEHDVLRKVDVFLDRDVPWVATWNRAEPMTGNPVVDALMREADLEVRPLYVPPRWYEVVAPDPLNTAEVGRRLRRVDGVNARSFTLGDAWFSLGGHADSAGWVLETWLGDGDCPSGCRGDTTELRVWPDGGVWIMRAGGRD